MSRLYIAEYIHIIAYNAAKHKVDGKKRMNLSK